MKIYFDAVKHYFQISGYRAEKWLDKNNMYLSGDATNLREAIKEIKEKGLKK